jgi:multiple sugar transport system permease protein
MSVAALPARRRRLPPSRIGLHAFLIAMCVLWLFPLLWAVYTSLRPISDTIRHGFVSLPGTLNFDNYVNAWNQAELPHYYLNTLIVTIPGVILTLLVASMVAFGVSRFTWKFNLFVLLMFTAGNLLPPQVIIVPLYWMYQWIHVPLAVSDNGLLLYDQFLGIILIHVVFQLGFSIFVLSSYMRTLSQEIIDSALVDGASVFRIWWNVILPLCRPALAALATLLFTWIYNDFFWALLLMETGAKRPITSALNNLKSEFFINNNLLAAGAVLVAIPTVLVFIALQRHFIRGLTLGATKG